MLHDAVDKRRELASIAKSAGSNGIEDTFQLWVDLEVAVEMGVAQIFDVFGEIPKKEDIVLADLPNK